MQLEIKKLSPGAVSPKYQTPLSAGMDLHALIEQDWEILPGKQKIIPTGIAVSIPSGYEIQVRPRSGFSAKHCITITNSPGTIDADYLDEVFVILMNLGDKPFVVHNGDRIAQMVVNKVEQANVEVVEEFSDLNKDRGGGFGSTGI